MRIVRRTASKDIHPDAILLQLVAFALKRVPHRIRQEAAYLGRTVEEFAGENLFQLLIDGCSSERRPARVNFIRPVVSIDPSERRHP